MLIIIDYFYLIIDFVVAPVAGNNNLQFKQSLKLIAFKLLVKSTKFLLIYNWHKKLIKTLNFLRKAFRKVVLFQKYCYVLNVFSCGINQIIFVISICFIAGKSSWKCVRNVTRCVTLVHKESMKIKINVKYVEFQTKIKIS